MGGFLKSAVAGVLAGFVAMSAQAADMPRLPIPLSDETPLVTEEFSSGWYLRGDLGYRINRVGSAVSFIPPDPDQNKLENSFTLGAGVGYKHNWFRADATVEYDTRAKYVGSIAGVNTHSMTIDGYTGLLNGYFDLGTWSGITPYFGGGAGVSSLSGAVYLGPLGGAMPPILNKWTFTWAGMAGISARMHANIMVDVGYRYINYGRAHGGSDTDSIVLKNISANEIRVGLRYLLD